MHFVEFCEIGCFQSCMKNQDCVWSETPSKNVNIVNKDVNKMSHSARCVKVMIDFMDKRKKEYHNQNTSLAKLQ